jgi:hypothetical protein
MTYSFTKTLMVCAALLTTTIATSAHAGNAFNKFNGDKSVTATHYVHNSAYAETATVKYSPKTKTRIKRVVKPVPAAPTNRIAYASDNGTVIVTDGFNKMSASSGASAMATPVFVDKYAMSAR